MNIQEIEQKLFQILEAFKSDLPPDQIADMKSLIEAGEPGVAFENLCTQLHEYDISIPHRVLRQLANIGGEMELRPEYWEQLEVNET